VHLSIWGYTKAGSAVHQSQTSLLSRLLPQNKLDDEDYNITNVARGGAARAVPPQTRARATLDDKSTKTRTGQGATGAWGVVPDGPHWYRAPKAVLERLNFDSNEAMRTQLSNWGVPDWVTQEGPSAKEASAPDSTPLIAL
jgi:hypothetical protein